jgi:hypothetical protein
MASTTSQATTNAQRVILRTSDDWRLWITQLEAYTADKTFWAIYIDPKVAIDASPIEKPEPPAPYKFSAAYRNAQNAWENRTPISEDRPEAPVPSEYPLTSDERIAYGQEWSDGRRHN